ncbi:MAG: hypothetical protein CSA66_02035 [Proteobacteria bacterium]|nr:MAG: hypothetical protein CSA66_02035 [Pseudomonadota bacterium]
MTGADASRKDSPKCPAAFDATYRERLVVLGGFFGAIVVATVLGLVFVPKETGILFGYMALSFFALGKFLPLVAIGDPTFGFYDLGALIWAMDTVTVLLLVYSLEGLYRLRPAARAMNAVQSKAAVVLQAFPRIRRYAVIGMILFVLFPVSGTGAIGGTFLGILLGLHRVRVIAAVTVGGALGGFGMAFLADHFGTAIEAYKNNPWVIAALVGALLAALVAMNIAYRRAIRRAEAAEAAEAARR